MQKILSLNKIIGYLTLLLFCFFSCSEDSERISNNRTFSVYPNPCKQRAYVAVHNQSNTTYSLTVFDAKGKAIAKMECQPETDLDYTVMLADKADGVYHAVLETGSKSFVIEFLKID
jgi:hypothetical protein